MKNRKQQTLVKNRARQRPAKRGAARRRPGPARVEASRGAVSEARHQDGALALHAECTVAEADSLKSDLARVLDEAGPVTVDVSALQRIDTAALQLLAAFVRDRRIAGRAVQWRGRAAALDVAAGLLGLHDMLELPGEVGR